MSNYDELLRHLDDIAWERNSEGDPECFDQGAAMAADAIRYLETELAAKTAEVEALREDSERLNFLIDYCASFMNSKGEQLPENSRAAIDAARKEQK